MTYYQNWKNVPERLWRWPDFSPAEIACRGTGKLLVNQDALDKLQALRHALGRPIILNSGYRSPEHNKRVGGAAKSMHLEGRAFDISMANHDPAEFIRAARAAGFTGIGTYPRSNFVHVDTGPPRGWGEPFPSRPSRFAIDTIPAPDRLSEDKALRAAGIAGVGTVAATGTELAQQALAETNEVLAPLLPWISNARWLFMTLAMAGVALVVWTRIQDWQRGRS